MPKALCILRDGTFVNRRWKVLFSALAFCAPWVPAAAQSPDLALLDQLEKGAWEIRYRDDTPTRRICVASGKEFIRLRHQRDDCGRYSVQASRDQVTVQYTCTGNGFGRTKIRMETRALVQLEGHGIASGLPYQFTAEARRVGTCN